MIRRPDWETRLIAFARGEMGKPFAYGKTDCPMMVFGSIEAMTGEPVTDQYRGAWDSRASALKYMLRHRTHLLRAIEALGGVPVEPTFMQTGDLVVTEALAAEHSEGAALVRRFGVGWLRGHVCLGSRVLSSTAETGPCLIPVQRILTETVGQHRIHVRRIG